MSELLSVQDLRVSYQSRAARTEVLHGVSFAVRRGEVVALVGESGSGKSTTAHAVVGLLAENGTLDGGRIRLGETALTGLGERGLRAVRGRRIGLVPQDPNNSLNPVKRIGESLGEVLRIHAWGSKEAIAERVLELLEQVGIDDPARRARQYPHELSGGMKQRVLIASAIALEPELIIADEPTSALDVTVQRRILDLIDQLRERQGSAVLLVTHDLGVAAERADRIVVLRDGHIVEAGPTAQILTRAKHEYTRSLLAGAAALHGALDAGRDAVAVPVPVSAPVPVRRVGGGIPVRDLVGAQLGGTGLGGTGLSMEAMVAGVPPAGGSVPVAADVVPAGGGARSVRARVVEPDRIGAQVASRVRVSSEQAPSSAVEVAGLVQEFGGFRAVDGLSLSVPYGSTHAIVGESGSGKTTAVRAILGYHPASAGTIMVDQQVVRDQRGRTLRPKAVRELRRSAQLVLQNPYSSLDPRQRVASIVAEPLVNFRVGDRASRRRLVADILDRVALGERVAQSLPRELSGGQRQRVAIARALVIRPRVVVLDEPVSALDVTVQAQILRLLAELQDELGLTYLVISHDLGVIASISDTVSVMRAGRVVEQGSTATVFAHPERSYTRELLAAIPGRRDLARVA